MVISIKTYRSIVLGGNNMTSYDYFEELCNTYNVKPYHVCTALSISGGTINGWKRGKYTPKLDKLKKIADYFSVDVNKFIEVESNKDATDAAPRLLAYADKISKNESLSFDENLLVSNYQALDSKNKVLLLEISKALLKK